MKYNTFFLGNICEIIAGQSPPSNTYNKEGNGLPFFQGKADFGTYSPKVRVWCNAPQKIAKKGDILISVRAPVGPTNVCDQDCCIGRGLSAIRAKDKINSNYLRYFLKKREPILSGQGRGSTFSSIIQKDLKEIKISLPPLKEQKHIVQILDTADSLCQKRKEQLKLLDDYLKSVFLKMFGDSVKNEKGWEKRSIREISEKFSDGPFGSNLKTEHYRKIGVRVIRLKNIDVNEFKNDDKSFISQEHYETIKKHTCYPGDVLIATMGDPNIRACILPSNIKVAINKADCIQLRPNAKVITSEYICGQLNSSAAISLIAKFLHGQTRTRISMGQLSTLDIPIPPIELQNKFASIVEQVEQTKQKMCASLEEMDNHFNALMQRFFG